MSKIARKDQQLAVYGSSRLGPLLNVMAAKCMPLWHNKDKSENPCVARSWLFVLILFPPKNDPKMGSTGGDDKRKLHAKDKFPWTKVSGQNQDFLKLFRGAKT